MSRLHVVIGLVGQAGRALSLGLGPFANSFVFLLATRAVLDHLQQKGRLGGESLDGLEATQDLSDDRAGRRTFNHLLLEDQVNGEDRQDRQDQAS